jgi:hypothetical protein
MLLYVCPHSAWKKAGKAVPAEGQVPKTAAEAGDKISLSLASLSLASLSLSSLSLSLSLSLSPPRLRRRQVRSLLLALLVEKYEY